MWKKGRANVGSQCGGHTALPPPSLFLCRTRSLAACTPGGDMGETEPVVMDATVSSCMGESMAAVVTRPSELPNYCTSSITLGRTGSGRWRRQHE